MKMYINQDILGPWSKWLANIEADGECALFLSQICGIFMILWLQKT